jgi:hypothetical protein
MPEVSRNWHLLSIRLGYSKLSLRRNFRPECAISSRFPIKRKTARRPFLSRNNLGDERLSVQKEIDGTGQLKLHSHAGWYDYTLEPANPLPLRCEDSSPHVPGSHLRRWQ